MDLKPAPKRFAILIALLGFSLSLGAFYLLKDSVNTYLRALSAIEDYLPWIVLISGMVTSVLVAAFIRATQLAQERTKSLKASNKNLMQEIKERLELEDSKQKLEVALLQGQKLQAMGTLAGGIAHDFNNILYAIIGYAELVEQDVEKNSLSYKNLTKIVSASQRGKDLVARILAFSRRQPHEVSEIDLNSTIEAALSLLRPTIPASVTIHYESGNPMVIDANQTQIHQVLVNLINNAVDAMDGHGDIFIKCSITPANDPYLKQFPISPENTYCKIEVTDSGHGMNQHTLERIFEPFYTTKEVGKGTGLGLSIVHSIIKNHQGDVSAKSQLGQGASFVILLPARVKSQGE